MNLRPARAPMSHARSSVSAERSEEHTSELQSRSDLVCRLLLEKKKEHLAGSGVHDRKLTDQINVIPVRMRDCFKRLNRIFRFQHFPVVRFYHHGNVSREQLVNG